MFQIFQGHDQRAKCTPHESYLRELQATIITHLGSYYLRMFPTDLVRERYTGWALPFHLWHMRNCKVFNVHYEDDPFRLADGTLRSEPSLANDEMMLEQFLWGSPKLRELVLKVYELHEQPITAGKDHITVFTRSLRTAEMAGVTLDFAGFATKVVHEDVVSERLWKELDRDFNHRDIIQVLVISMIMSFQGLTLHKRCDTAIFLDCVPSVHVFNQAMGCVFRDGQAGTTNAIRLHVESTLQEEWENEMVEGAMRSGRVAVRVMIGLFVCLFVCSINVLCESKTM